MQLYSFSSCIASHLCFILLQVFFQILDVTCRMGDRILVFSQSLFTLTLLEEFLQRSYIPGMYEGWQRNR